MFFLFFVVFLSEHHELVTIMQHVEPLSNDMMLHAKLTDYEPESKQHCNLKRGGQSRGTLRPGQPVSRSPFANNKFTGYPACKSTWNRTPKKDTTADSSTHMFFHLRLQLFCSDPQVPKRCPKGSRRGVLVLNILFRR